MRKQQRQRSRRKRRSNQQISGTEYDERASRYLRADRCSFHVLSDVYDKSHLQIAAVYSTQEFGEQAITPNEISDMHAQPVNKGFSAEHHTWRRPCSRS